MSKGFKIFTIFFLLVFSVCLNSQARIAVADLDEKQGEINSKHFGSFIEYLDGFLSGPFGLWSQELVNRGFDMKESFFPGVSYPWNVYNPLNTKNDKIELFDGGYNENGLYYQRISKKSADGLYGISQNVYVYDSVGGDFYVYIRTSTNSSKAHLLLCDTLTDDILFSADLTGIDSVWHKFSVDTPPIKTTHTVKLVICLSEPGTIDIDESSFMPKNNVNGVREEFYRLFKEWQPGIIRYPGGWFADTKFCHLEAAIGHIDKRSAPNLINIYSPQRMDFGLDEFMLFCDSINAEAHLVVNLETGTSQQAANWVDYCNTPYDMSDLAAQRAANGHKEPYGVRYWEIGNEQWLHPHKMALDYLEHYKAMKKIDGSIRTMVDGNIWGGEEFLDTVFSVVGDKCDIYSYHSIFPVEPSTPEFDEPERFKSVMATATLPDIEAANLKKWLEKWNLDEKLTLAITELILHYNVPWNVNDSTLKTGSLETGIWMASFLNACLRNCEYFEIVEKTFGIGHIKTAFNKQGERIIYPTPFHIVLSYMNINRGDYNVPVKVESDEYTTEPIEGMFMMYNIPYLDASVSTKDSIIYISVANRHPIDSIETVLDLPLEYSRYDMIVHELNAESYQAANSVDDPNRLNYSVREMPLKSTYIFPAHSHTLLEIYPHNRAIPGDTLIFSNSEYIINPNPAEDILYITLPDESDSENIIYIYNLMGQLVKRIVLSANTRQHAISIADLSIGSYFLTVTNSQKQVFSSSFIKL